MNEALYIPATSCRNLLTVRNSPGETERSDFKVREGRSEGFFVLASGSQVICLLVSRTLHTYVHYPMAENNKRAELLHQKGGSSGLFSLRRT